MKGDETQIIAFYGKGSPKGTGGSHGIDGLSFSSFQSSYFFKV